MHPERPAEFDIYAHSYDMLLEKSLRIAGEPKEYFARKRLEFLASALGELGKSPRRILDFGCGTGSTIPVFMELFDPECVIGLDDSQALLDVARRDFAGPRVNYLRPSEFRSLGEIDLVFCSAVFHHIPPDTRRDVARQIHSYLRPGGLFAFWEHNAWSPAARFVMSRCEFDEGCIPLSAREARKVLRAAGFEVLRTDFRFVFPRALSWLRSFEPIVSRMPLGAQFQLLCRKAL